MTAKYHGPRFAEWITNQAPVGVRYLTETHQRALREYRAGRGHVTEPTADSICCALDLHIKLIPEEVELPRIDRFTARLIVRDLDAGYRVDEIARHLEVPPGLVRSFA